MRIAIVDDDEEERKILRDRLCAQSGFLLGHWKIFEYETGAAFLEAAALERFDLLFLDIYLKEESGIQIAEELRRFDPDCILVFTTISTDFALEAFHVRAMQYLVKPYTEEELTAFLEELKKRLPVPAPCIEVKSLGGHSIRLYFHEILYAEHFQHHIYIWTADNQKITIRQTFREFSQDLQDPRFFLCSRGLLVNLEYTEDFDGRDFILKNGKRIPVSRGLSKAARAAFGEFLFGRRGPL